jgi:hypothetical protein
MISSDQVLAPDAWMARLLPVEFLSTGVVDRAEVLRALRWRSIP